MTTSTSIGWIRDFTQEWLDAWNSHDPDRLLALMTEDIEYRDDGWPQPMHGHTDVRTFLESLWRAFPDMTFSVDLLVESGDIVVSNWTVRGTHTGAPFYDVAPSGRPVIINGTAILRIRGGRIVEHWGGPHCQEGLGLIR